MRRRRVGRLAGAAAPPSPGGLLPATWHEPPGRAHTTDIVSLVSHELRTPLSIIMGGLELLLDGDAGPLSPAQQRLVGSVERNAQRLFGAVDDLLILVGRPGGARPTRGRGVYVAESRLRRQAVALRAVVERALRVLAACHPAVHARVRALLPDAPVWVRGDGEELVRMVVNLVVQPGTGSLELALGDGQGGARLRVTSGPDADRDPHPPGDLRLAVAAQIARRHGGALIVSEAAGGARTVVVRLPLLRTTAPSWRTTR